MVPRRRKKRDKNDGALSPVRGPHPGVQVDYGQLFEEATFDFDGPVETPVMTGSTSRGPVCTPAAGGATAGRRSSV